MMRKKIFLILTTFLLLLTLPVFAEAQLVNVTRAHELALGGIVTAADYVGIEIRMNNNTDFVAITKDNTISATNALIVNVTGTNTVLVNATFDAQGNATFDPITLVRGDTYFIVVHSNGASQNRTFVSSAVVTHGEFNWTNGVFGGTIAALGNDGNVFSILSMTVQSSGAPADVAPVLTVFDPANNTRNNTNLEVRYNVQDSDSGQVTCNLLVNTTGVFSINNTITNISVPSNTTISANTVGLDEHFEPLQYILSCNDGGLETNSTARVWTLDTINPAIDSFTPAGGSSFDPTTQNISFAGQFSDVGTLFNVSVRFINATFFTLFTQFNDTASLTTLRINGTIALTDLPDGAYQLSLRASDPSTNARIPDWNVKTDAVKREIVVDNDVVITLVTGPDMDGLTTTKLADRISWQYDFSVRTPKTNAVHVYTFLLESENAIVQYPHPLKDAHFVIPDSNKWVSFDADGVEASDYTFVRISAREWRVIIRTTETTLNFNSVGELNILNENRSITLLTGVPAVAADSELPLQGVANLVAMAALLMAIIGFVALQSKKK